MVTAARLGWRWQWQRLMGGLGLADAAGNYTRPNSDPLTPPALNSSDLLAQRRANGPAGDRAQLPLGAPCLVGASAAPSEQQRHPPDGNSGSQRRTLGPPASLGGMRHAARVVSALRRLQLPGHRASAGDPKTRTLLCNDSAPLVGIEPLAAKDAVVDLTPPQSAEKIEAWQALLQPAVNDGVYRCGFARNQAATTALKPNSSPPWMRWSRASQPTAPGSAANNSPSRMCASSTLIRWELVYAPLFGCSRRPLWHYPHLWAWRQRLYALPGVADTCDGGAWRHDYFGALFPLNPGGIVPAGPDLSTLVNSTAASG